MPTQLMTAWRPKQRKQLKQLQDKREPVKRLRNINGFVAPVGPGSSFYRARIHFDAVEMYTEQCDLPTALEYLVILTSVKQKMLETSSASFDERLREAIQSCAREQDRDGADLNLRFAVRQRASIFFGRGYQMQSPSVRSIEEVSRIRTCLAPFRAFARYKWGGGSIFWWHSPADLDEAWQNFQVAIAEAWQIAGADCTHTLQKIRGLYTADVGYRSKHLQTWESQHMAMQDERRHRLKAEKRSKQLEVWERQQMARHDRNRHRPRRLRDTDCQDRERRERQQMALEDKTKHQSKRLRRLVIKRSPQEILTNRLSTLKKLLACWEHLLNREARQMEKEHRRQLEQRQRQFRKAEAERRRLEILHRQKLREEERARKEHLRKRMRSDLTMEEILAWKNVKPLVPLGEV